MNTNVSQNDNTVADRPMEKLEDYLGAITQQAITVRDSVIDRISVIVGSSSPQEVATQERNSEPNGMIKKDASLSG